MDINIKSTNIDLPQTLVNYIYEKIGALEKFIDIFEKKGVIKIWVEVGKITKHHRKGIIYRAEADVSLPGKILRAEHEDADVRVAIDFLKEKLAKQIKKYNEKVRVQDSRG